jgi:hypothetical protein
MPRRTDTPIPPRSAAAAVRASVTGGGARFWKRSDFERLPAFAVATELSRLARRGELQRVGKGVYYRPAPTAFGPSLPAATAAAAQTLTAPVHPAGLSAANVLGLTTQNPLRAELATPAAKRPTALADATVLTNRPAARARLSAQEGAILEVLRDRARSSDLPPRETARRLLDALATKRTYSRLVAAALAGEPPRVRAMLGALGQELDMPDRLLARLRASLNPLSRFDFGALRTLRHASEWQAK